MTSESVIEWFGLKVGESTAWPVEIPNVNRVDLARLLGEWGLNRGVEVGTFRGEYAQVLLEQNPALYLVCVDLWELYEGYPDYQKPQTLERAKEAAQRVAQHYGRCALIRAKSVDAAAAQPDGSFDFVYIDANHDFAHVTEDLEAWVPKVRKGGIVAGHDYLQRAKWPHLQVVRATHAYTAEHGINRWFVLGYRKAPGSDYARSWFWVNE